MAEMAASPADFDTMLAELTAQLQALGASPQQAAEVAVQTVKEAARPQVPAPIELPKIPEMEPNALAGKQPRTVPAPVYSLGGKRMDGARKMTPQEERMQDNPAAQMGIDAGAALTRGINAAGLGIPGIVMDYAAPNALASIRENEANANMVARGVGDIAGSLGAPVGTIGRGIVGGGKAAAETFNALPTAGKFGVTLGPAAALPSEAATPETSKPSDFSAPSLWQEAVAAAKGFFGKEPGTDQPMSRDEFLQARRTIQPKTFEAILAEEKANVKNDPMYGRGPNTRAALEKKAEDTALKRFEASKGDLTTQDTRLGKEYDDYAKGWQDQRDQYYNRQFSERHPNAAMAMTVGGPMVSALATKGIFGKIDKAGSDIAAAANTARVGGDMLGLAENLIKADNYASRAPIGKALTVAEATAFPAELRMMQDVIDKKGLPPNAGARKAAEERMADIPSYAAGMGWDLVSGLIGTGTGGLLNKYYGKSPSDALAVTQAYGRGIDVSKLAPDEMAAALRERMQANRLAGDMQSSAPAGSGASLPRQPDPLQQVPGVVVEPNALAGPQTSLTGPLGARGRFQDPTLGPGALSNQPPSEILKGIQPAPRDVPTNFPKPQESKGAPAGAAEKPASPEARKLPPNVIQDVNGVYYDKRTGHKIPKKFYDDMGLE